MALIKCPDCGKMFSEYAECCPVCGCPVEDAKREQFTDKKEEENIISNTEQIVQSDSFESDIKKDSSEAIPLSKETKSETNSSFEVKRTESLNNSPIEDVVYSDDNDSKEKKILGFFAALVLGALLIYGLFNYYNKPNSTDDKSKEITEIANDSIDNSESKESSKEQQIIARAEYIFKNLPDHSELAKIDKSVFSSSFLGVLEKASELNDKCMREGDLSMDELFYWFSGNNEMGPNDGLKEISLLSCNDEKALVIFKYKCGKIIEHTMKLIQEEGKWLCDNWDKKKEELAESIEIVSKNIETESSDFEQNGDVNDEFVEVEDNHVYENVDEKPQSKGGPSKRRWIYHDFKFDVQIGKVHLDYYENGKEVFDVFESDGRVLLDFKKYEKGNLLKLEYRIDKFGEKVFVKYIQNVRVLNWSYHGMQSYGIKDNNNNDIISLYPLGAYEGDTRYRVWIWEKWLTLPD